VLPPARGNILRGSSFKDDDTSGTGNLADGQGSLNGYWLRWNGAPPLGNPPSLGGALPASENYIIAGNTGDLIYWDTNQLAVVFNNNAWLVQNVRKRLLPGQLYTLSTVKLACAPNPISGLILRIYFKRQDNAGDNMYNMQNPGLTYIPLPLTGLNTGFQEFGIGLQMLKAGLPGVNPGTNAVALVGTNPGNTRPMINEWVAFFLEGIIPFGSTVLMKDPRIDHGSVPMPAGILEVEEGSASNFILPSINDQNAGLSSGAVGSGFNFPIGGLIGRNLNQ